MSHHLRKYKKILLEPLENFKNLMKQAETLCVNGEDNCKTSRSTFQSPNRTIQSNLKSPIIMKRKNLINERLYNTLSYESERFNVVKKVKEIKQITQELYNSNDPFLKNKFRIGFDKKNSKYVFDSRRQLIEHKKKRANKLIDRDGSINKYIYDNKHIGINNYLINFLRNECKKINEKKEEKKKKLEDKELNLTKNKEKFVTYIQNQNIAFKKIENAYSKIGEFGRQLLREEYQQKLISKSIADEMEKILNNLEELREVCKFVTEIAIGGNNKQFDKKIVKRGSQQLMHLNNENFDFNKLTTRTIKNYKFCLERDENEEKELNEILGDSNMMELKFNEIEDRIIRLLSIIQQIRIENDNMKEDIEKSIKEMKERIEFHEKEYDLVKELYHKELDNIKKIPLSNKNQFAIEFINEIYDTVLKYESNNPKVYHGHFYSHSQNFTNNNNKLNFNELEFVKECEKKIRNEETKINNYIYELEKFEKQDPNLFLEIIEKRKIYNKEIKQLELKRKLDGMRDKSKEKSENRFNKIIIKSRKTEAPFRIFKKTIKIEKEKPKYNPDYEMIIYN